ncbi:MAG: M48 family metallopeptidase [Melioribacteraceae bacterium]|nr:M48 family metallopeptidase [Melioribacteraceae bacterium]MCF8355034.1 M48 family metallopeptidase [Melioribacteraceae bacterium]MCF8392713.1 M48 family metallopeptidase [Melioribacteraceae bacterium]MCF8417735.1 M48 family metallopeptidase [Melioribacteraceae bacterium]
MQQRQIKFGSKKVNYSLKFTDRKTLGITVTPESDVIVKAPLNSSFQIITEKIEKRAPWILKQIDYFNSFKPLTPPRKYFAGETHYYLGKQYRLKLVATKMKSVKLQGKYFYVYTPNINNTNIIKKQMDEWYREHAEFKFAVYIDSILKQNDKIKFDFAGFYLRKMNKRWGSCNKNGTISFNLDLIKAPKGCIDYVIIHELCHLKYPNHSKKFYSLQKKLMPNWEIWKERLEKYMA